MGTQQSKKRLRQQLLTREAQSDDEFCSTIPKVDRQLALRLRQLLATTLGVPSENLHASDKLAEDLGCGYPFEELYERSLGGRSIFEVHCDEVVDIIDKPDHTFEQCAEELRLLTDWTARQREQSTSNGTGENDDEILS